MAETPGGIAVVTIACGSLVVLPPGTSALRYADLEGGFTTNDVVRALKELELGELSKLVLLSTNQHRLLSFQSLSSAQGLVNTKHLQELLGYPVQVVLPSAGLLAYFDDNGGRASDGTYGIIVVEDACDGRGGFLHEFIVEGDRHDCTTIKVDHGSPLTKSPERLSNIVGEFVSGNPNFGYVHIWSAGDALPGYHTGSPFWRSLTAHLGDFETPPNVAVLSSGIAAFLGAALLAQATPA